MDDEHIEDDEKPDDKKKQKKKKQKKQQQQKNGIFSHDGFKYFFQVIYILQLSTRFNFFYNLKYEKKTSLSSQGKHIVTWTKTFNIKPILANSCEEKMVNDHN